MGDNGIPIAVNVLDIVQVRDDGLYAPELLALIVGAAEHLSRVEKRGVFNGEFVNLTSNGDITITMASSEQLDEDFLPPELRDNIFDRIDIEEPQLVWCLGDVARQAFASTCTDIYVSSLVNTMCTQHVGTRPTLAKLLQMTRKQCTAQGIQVRGVLQALYEEIMGTFDDLVSTVEDLDVEGVPMGVRNAVVRMSKRREGHKVAQAISLDTSDDNASLATLEDSTDEGEQGIPHPRIVVGNGILPPVEEETSHRHAVIRRLSEDDSTTARSSISDGTVHPASSVGDDTISAGSLESVHVEVNEPSRTSLTNSNHVTPTQESFYSETMQQSKLTRTPEFEKFPFPVGPVSSSALPSSSRTSTIETVNEEEEEADEPPTRPDLKSSPKMTTHKQVLNHYGAHPHSQSITESSAALSINSSNRVVSARKKSTGSVTSLGPPKPPRSPITPVEPPVGDQVALSRHNSMEPARIRRKGSSKRLLGTGTTPVPKKSFANPEFIERQSQVVNRLQAQPPVPSRKKFTLCRIEQTHIFIHIISGQTVEVNCRSDAIVSTIFDTVVSHFNITEHIFFGLAIMRDAEFFYLEPEQRLEKYAPAGWKNRNRNQGDRYTLHLRFKYYPKKLAFVKTSATTHFLYLQLRQDILNDVLKPPRDKTFELAALALQTEFGDRVILKLGKKVPYFHIKHYLPGRVYLDQDVSMIEDTLSDHHGRLQGLDVVLAEKQFIELCQAEAEYGAHYYRAFKHKLTATGGAVDNFRDINWISIMPDGIGICFPKGLAQTTYVVMDTFFQWHTIRSLEFDRKRFVITTLNNSGELDEHTYYTDHYSKSGYLMRFAASQHKFMIKMRMWQWTLTRDRPATDMERDVGAEKTVCQDVDSAGLFPMIPTTSSQLKPPEITLHRPEDQPGLRESIVDTTEDELTLNSLSDSSRRIKLDIQLLKDPTTGLGLTLVDGKVDDVQGVFVRGVAPNSDAESKGIEKGDCIAGVGGVSLIGKTRHDAVQLVKSSGAEVALTILRFPYLSQVLSHSRETSRDDTLSGPPKGTTSNGVYNSKPEISLKVQNSHKKPIASQTPPAPKWVAPHQRQRAVSDFGAIGDALPTLNSEDILTSLDDKRARLRSKSHSEDNVGDLEVTKYGRTSVASGDVDYEDGEARRGKYNIPVTELYEFEEDDDEPVSTPHRSNDENSAPLYRQGPKRTSDHFRSFSMDMSEEGDAAAVETRSTRSGNSRQNLDWANDLSDIEEPIGPVQKLTIKVDRGNAKSLGFQVASNGPGRVYVKAITSEPALSTDLKIGDRILEINQRSTAQMTHESVVSNLRIDRSPIILLKVERELPPVEAEEHTISVRLEKTPSVNLGLSLARRVGDDGIFIRNIAANSIAERNGGFRVGDRVLTINGQDVVADSPAVIVDRLRAISDRYIDIVVKRSID